jgi:hypothetical protein
VLLGLRVRDALAAPWQTPPQFNVVEFRRYLARHLRDHWNIYMAIRTGDGPRAGRLLAANIFVPGRPYTMAEESGQFPGEQAPNSG